MNIQSEYESLDRSTGSTSGSLFEQSHEEKLLGSKSPLRTVISLSWGPIISQMSIAISSLIESFYCGKAFGDIGIQVLGAIFVVDFISSSVSQYLSAGLSIQTSYLIGQKRTNDTSQMFVDFLRLILLFSVLIPSIILPIVRPLVEWFGADKELSFLCFKYMFPIAVGSPLTLLFGVTSGLLLGEGRSVQYGVYQTLSMCLCVFVFDPLFLFVYKMPIWSLTLSTVISQGIPALIILLYTLSGKTSLKVSYNMFFRRFSPETWKAMNLGISSLLESISISFPLLFLQKYINLSASAIGEYDSVIMIWGIVERLYLIVGAVLIGFSLGLTPAASFAHGSNDHKRFKSLSLHALWLSTLWSTLFSVAMIVFVRPISSFWSTDEHFLSMAEKMIPILFYTSPTLGLQYIAPAMLQSMQRILRSSILTVLTLVVPQPAFSTLLYYTNKRDPIRMMYAYVLNDIFSFLVDIVFLIRPMKELRVKQSDL